MIEKLIALVLASRNAAHLAHWRTKSFSEHMALNEFYDNVLDVLDARKGNTDDPARTKRTD